MSFFLFYFWREKESKSRFWSDGIFFGLGRFLNLLGRGTSQVFFFDKRPLNVGCHVLNRLKVDKHGSGFLFSLTVLKRKAPIEFCAMF